MDRISEWLEATAAPVLDSERDREIDGLARELAKAIRREGRFFDINDSAPFLNGNPDDLQLVKERVYELALRRVLKDFAIDGDDRLGLRWIARTLGLIGEAARRIELRVGRRVFEEYLMFAMSGGYLDEEELRQLQSMAAGLDVPTRDLLLGYVTENGEHFLQRLVDGMADDGRITDQAWGRLLATAAALGVPGDELMALLRVHAKALATRLNTAGSAEPCSQTPDPGAVRSLLLRLSVPSR